VDLADLFTPGAPQKTTLATTAFAYALTRWFTIMRRSQDFVDLDGVLQPNGRGEERRPHRTARADVVP
jgi:hypothetical protein